MLTPDLARLVAQTVTVSTTSSGRPALTFFLVQVLVGLGVHTGHVALPEGVLPLVSAWALALGATLAVAELLAQHLDDVEAVLRELRYDRIAGALGALGATLIFASLGLPEEEALAPAEAAGALVLLEASGYELGVQAAALGGALALNLVLTWARARVLEALGALDLRWAWQVIETGGVAAVILLLPVAPVLTLLLVVVVVVALGSVGALLRGGQVLVDRRARRPCPACAQSIRVEASLCWGCGVAVAPERLLARASARGGEIGGDGGLVPSQGP